MKEKSSSGAVFLVVGGFGFLILACIVGAGAAGYMYFVKRAEDARRPLAVTPAVSCPPDKLAAIGVDGLVLPDLGGLPGARGAGADQRGTTIPRLTVLIDKWGAATLEGHDSVGKWRGTNLPRDVSPTGDKADVRQLDEIVVSFAKLENGKIRYRIRRWQTTDIRELAAQLHRLKSVATMPMVLDPRPDTPFGPVAGVISIGAGLGLPVRFRTPNPLHGKGAVSAVPRNLRNELVLKSAQYRRPDCLSALGVRIRADARGPWKSVGAVLMACMEAKVHRVAFSGVLGGVEVTIGRLEGPGVAAGRIAGFKPIEPPIRHEPDLEVVSGIDVEKPVVIHEEAEIADHFETGNKTKTGTGEDAISNIPLGPQPAMGVGGGGTVGVFGFRDRSGRKRAAARWGGSPATESTVEAGLRWLARHQEADGSWKPKKWGAAKGASAERVSALATLAFLGAGYTPKSGKFRDNVRRAIKWLISKQKADGSLGDDARTHAICAQVLVEVYGMTKDRAVGNSAQEAVDRAIVFQKAGSGWPKAKPDLKTTAPFVTMFKAAKIAGLKVPNAAFFGAMAFLGKVTDKGGRCSNLPGGKVDVGASARGAFCLMLMGAKPKEAVVKGAAKHILTSPPPGDVTKLQVENVFWGTQASFQCQGETWKTWNKAMKKTFVNNQRKGGPMDGSRQDVDGSWDSPGGARDILGRAGRTALATLSLEVYYRYLPLHMK